MSQHFSHDVLVIGSGAAGLSLALRLDPAIRVAVIAKSDLSEGSTRYAQGGISAVLDPGDSVQAHIADTLNAGAGLCKPETVRFTAEHGAAQVHWLQSLGMPFTVSEDHNDECHLTREGGHSHRREIGRASCRERV